MRSPLPRPVVTPNLIGESAALQTLRDQIRNVSQSDAKICIQGETGSGKELVAQLVHATGLRRGRPFVALNCGAITETLLASELFGHKRGSFTGADQDKLGLIQLADGGTLFLDEVGEMSLAMQAMLLRFTETGEVHPVGSQRVAGHADVRLIVATHRDLRAAVRAGTFREDLYYRLHVVPLQVPPLRDRGGDVLLLFRHYAELASQSRGARTPELTPDAEAAIMAYRWPGNVRELRNLVERLVFTGPQRAVTAADLPSEITSERDHGRAVPVTPAVAADSRSGAAHQSPEPSGGPMTDKLWEALMAGTDFWTAVGRPFHAREVTRGNLEALVHRGLRHTNGSYRDLVELFNMPSSDYKRFHGFLYQHGCNAPVRDYRPKTRMARARVSFQDRVDRRQVAQP